MLHLQMQIHLLFKFILVYYVTSPVPCIAILIEWVSSPLIATIEVAAFATTTTTNATIATTSATITTITTDMLFEWLH
jgi:hypothetical protein